jgi:hypothetical protein
MAAVIYLVAVYLAALIFFQQFMNDGILIVAAVYVLGYCFVTGYLVFLLSVILKLTKLSLPEYERFIFLGLAAAPINIFNLFIGPLTSFFSLLIPLATLIVVYFGSKLYGKTWAKLETLNSLGKTLD